MHQAIYNGDNYLVCSKVVADGTDLDENPILVENLLNQIDATNVEEIYNENKKDKKYIQSEVGISSNIKIPQKKINSRPKFLMIGSTLLNLWNVWNKTVLSLRIY